MAWERSGRIRVGAVIIEWFAHSRWTLLERTRPQPASTGATFTSLAVIVMVSLVDTTPSMAENVT